MARRSKPTFTKRQKEMARQQKRQEKDARRLELKRRKLDEPAVEDGAADPEIAGIRPGPQPLPTWARTEEHEP